MAVAITVVLARRPVDVDIAELLSSRQRFADDRHSPGGEYIREPPYGGFRESAIYARTAEVHPDGRRGEVQRPS